MRASTYTTTGHRRRELGGWSRDYTVTIHEGPLAGTYDESARSCGPTDTTRLHSRVIHGDSYDARCPCCYLGHAHTLEYHEKHSGGLSR